MTIKNSGGILFLSYQKYTKEELSMGKVYVIGNFKGGVGKTKTVTMLAYESALHLGRKTLVIDLDPQGNATRVLAKTGDLDEITYTVTEAFQEGSLEPAITNISENLDLIPANTAFRNLTKIDTDSEVLSHNGITLNVDNGRMEIRGEMIDLSKNEYRLLYLLMKKHGKILTREKLLRALWDDERFVDDNTLTVNINRLRKKN